MVLYTRAVNDTES